MKQLMLECDLEKVKHEQVRNLDLYYKAQLCWAIAMLLEPRVNVYLLTHIKHYNTHSPFLLLDESVGPRTLNGKAIFYFKMSPFL